MVPAQMPLSHNLDSGLRMVLRQAETIIDSPQMTLFLRSFQATAFAAAMLSIASAASAQGAQPFGFFDRMFGGEERNEFESNVTQAQMSSSDLVMRLDRMENQIRQLTGTIEQLQYRNQQLDQQVRRMQEDNEYRFQEMGGRGGARPSAPARGQAVPGAPAAQQPVQPVQPAQPVPGRRSDVVEPVETPSAPVARRGRGDVFDPNENPNAPGAPRVLGSMSPIAGPEPGEAVPPEAPPIGAPGGRQAGAPLDLATMASAASSDPSLAPPGQDPYGQGGPAPRNSSGAGGAGGQVAAVEPPSASPRDAYDLAYGYVLRKDYALAEDGFRGFLRRHPNDRLAPDAHYWLGESMFQRQRYRDAAESFLTVSTKYETTGKAPDSLLRLGQSLAALGEKEAACAALGEVGRKYPRASLGVKQGVEREQKRVRC